MATSPATCCRGTESCLGRADELSELLSALAAERQVMLVGGPGEGKSALAAEAAHVLSEQRRLPGGAYIVDLATAPAAGAPMPLGGHGWQEQMA